MSLKVFVKPVVNSLYDTYEKRLRSFSPCDRFNASNRDVQRFYASQGLYFEFTRSFLMNCFKCGKYIFIDQELLLVSTPDVYWINLRVPCKCYEALDESEYERNLETFWPYYLRYFAVDYLNPDLKFLAEKCIFPSKFGMPKCFCCSSIIPFLDSPHSAFCLVPKAVRSAVYGPLCGNCKFLEVTVRALPCAHVSLCAICLIGKDKCPECNQKMDCIEFK